MKGKEITKYILFVVSLFINAFGIAFITKATLGTSPITSITLVMSLFTPLTMGQWTIILNLLFVILELPLMSRERLREDKLLYVSQIPVTLCFGVFIDISMSLLSWLVPLTYVAKLTSLAAGCVILAVGIALEVKVNVAMAAGEYFVRVIALRFRKDFGYVKLGFDSSLVLLSCAVSLIAMHRIDGVREGTVVAALIVGPIVHWITPFYAFVDRLTGKDKAAATPPAATAAAGIVVTIAREKGSGGHQLGERLARQLGVKLYDKELIGMAARRSGMDEDYIRRNEQTLPSLWLKRIMPQTGGDDTVRHGLSADDVLFVAESSIIDELAKKGPCVIVGRCSDYVLKDRGGVLRVFCHADAESEKRRCVEEYGMEADRAEAEIKRTNRNRRLHYEYYTGCKWGDPRNYDIVINTSRIDIATACTMIADACRAMER